MAYTPNIGFDERRQRIAEAAYFRAEKRGFTGGDPVADWINAEHEIDAELRRNGNLLLGHSEMNAPTAKPPKSPRKKSRQS
jgi:hypothetical protein